MDPLVPQVRKEWGLKGVGDPGWQTVMRHYLKQERVDASEKLRQVHTALESTASEDQKPAAAASGLPLLGMSFDNSGNRSHTC